jgi:hypothetical protein
MNKILLFFIGLMSGVLLILLVGVVGYYLLKDKYEIVSTSKVVQTKTENVVEQETPQTFDFVGSYVSATLPTDWSIVEHKDGAGTTMLVTGPSYTGLTALEVLNASSQSVFKLSAAYGIGGSDQCSTYAKFSDFNQADYSALNIQNVTNYQTVITLVDVSSEAFTKFDFLGLNVRRIGTTLYWDKVSGNEYFETASCGLDPSFPSITSLNFFVDGNAQTGYQWKVVGTPSNEDLLKLDSVLGSLKVI